MNSEDRPLAVIMWILSIPFPFIAPIVFLILGQNRPLVFTNAVQSLGFGVFIFVLWVAAWILAFVTFGLGSICFIVPAILHVLIPILGAVAAGSGRIYEPLVSGPVVKSLMRR